MLILDHSSSDPMERKAFNRIKAVLAEKGRTGNWLAERLNKNRTTISKWCTNQIQPPVETLYEVAEVLGVDVRELLVGGGVERC